MEKNEKSHTLNYNTYQKKNPEQNRLKIYNKSFCLNTFDIFKLTNGSNCKSVKNTLFPNNKKSHICNTKLNKSYRDKILDDINYIKKKIYTENNEVKKQHYNNRVNRFKSIEYKKRFLLDGIKEEMNSNKNNNFLKTNLKLISINNYNNKLKNITINLLKMN